MVWQVLYLWSGPQGRGLQEECQRQALMGANDFFEFRWHCSDDGRYFFFGASAHTYTAAVLACAVPSVVHDDATCYTDGFFDTSAWGISTAPDCYFFSTAYTVGFYSIWPCCRSFFFWCSRGICYALFGR